MRQQDIEQEKKKNLQEIAAEKEQPYENNSTA
jgi:hypothetical protein